MPYLNPGCPSFCGLLCPSCACRLQAKGGHPGCRQEIWAQRLVDCGFVGCTSSKYHESHKVWTHQVCIVEETAGLQKDRKLTAHKGLLGSRNRPTGKRPLLSNNRSYCWGSKWPKLGAVFRYVRCPNRCCLHTWNLLGIIPWAPNEFNK